MGWVDSFAGALVPHRCHWCSGPSASGLTCEACVRNLPWDTGGVAPAWAAFRYTPAIAAQIVGLKFHARFAPARVLGLLMAERLARRPTPLPELLVPVPLHGRRLRTRGYNQALELGRAIAARLGLQLAPQAARRLRHTQEQTRLDARQRAGNLRGAFEVSSAVAGRHVALLDDVITTGATTGELARAALAAGARSVEVWAAARAQLRRSEIEGKAHEHG